MHDTTDTILQALNTLETEILAQVNNTAWSVVDELVKQRETLLRNSAPLSQGVIDSAQAFNQQLTALMTAARQQLNDSLQQSQQKQKVSNAYLTVDGRKR